MKDVIVVFHYRQFFALLPNPPPLPPPITAPKNENFKKMKQRPADIIILHNCTKNYDYRPYCS